MLKVGHFKLQTNLSVCRQNNDKQNLVNRLMGIHLTISIESTHQILVFKLTFREALNQVLIRAPDL